MEQGSNQRGPHLTINLQSCTSATGPGEGGRGGGGGYEGRGGGKGGRGSSVVCP